MIPAASRSTIHECTAPLREQTCEERPRQSRQRKDRVLRIETIGFSVIVVLSWLTEIIHLPHLIYGEPFAPNWDRALLRTLVVVAIWVWVNRETKRVLHRLHHLEEFLHVCSWCRKIGDETKWTTMEEYFGANFSTRTTHGMCPECAGRFLARARSRPDATDARS